MAFFANRAANRMGARQQYRTMARMQRRRTYMQSSMGMRQDFQPADENQDQVSAQAEPNYTGEIEKLADMKSQGLITEDEFNAKKKQLLGI